MSKHKTGYDYVPDGGARRVIGPGELKFAAAGLDHGHIYAQTQGLINVGAECKWVWDTDRGRIDAFLQKFPGVPVARAAFACINTSFSERKLCSISTQIKS